MPGDGRGSHGNRCLVEPVVMSQALRTSGHRVAQRVLRASVTSTDATLGEEILNRPRSFRRLRLPSIIVICDWWIIVAALN